VLLGTSWRAVSAVAPWAWRRVGPRRLPHRRHGAPVRPDRRSSSVAVPSPGALVAGPRRACPCRSVTAWPGTASCTTRWPSRPPPGWIWSLTRPFISQATVWWPKLPAG